MTERGGGRSNATACGASSGATAGGRADRKASGEARIPPRYRHCDLDNFRDNNEFSSGAVRTGAWIHRTLSGRGTRSVVRRKPGVGKTHLAVAVLKEAIHRANISARAVLRDVRDLLKEIRNTYNPVVQDDRERSDQADHGGRAARARRPRRGKDVRVGGRDDRISSSIRATTIDGRRCSRRTTRCSTTRSIPIRSADRVGFRMWSRLHEMCAFVEMRGVDYREAGPDASPARLAELDRRGSASHRPPPPRAGKSMVKAQLEEQGSRLDRRQGGDVGAPGTWHSRALWHKARSGGRWHARAIPPHSVLLVRSATTATSTEDCSTAS